MDYNCGRNQVKFNVVLDFTYSGQLAAILDLCWTHRGANIILYTSLFTIKW